MEQIPVSKPVKDKTRRNYANARASFYAMLGATNPKDAKTVADEGADLLRDYILFWDENDMDDDKKLEKNIQERQLKSQCQVIKEYFVMKHQHKLYLSCIYLLKDNFAAADIDGKTKLL